MNIKVVEKFIDKHFGGEFRVAKTYYCSELASIEILPYGDGKSIYIWNEDLIEEEPMDNEFTIELKMQILYDKIRDVDGEKDMIDMICHFLGTEMVLCLCADYGDFIDIIEVDEDVDTDDIRSLYITPLLKNIGALYEGDSEILSEMFEKQLLHTPIDINGVNVYLVRMSREELRGK